jgi:hypothetical protein
MEPPLALHALDVGGEKHACEVLFGRVGAGRSQLTTEREFRVRAQAAVAAGNLKGH